MVEHIYNINAPEVEAEPSIVESQTLQYSELELDWLHENNSLCLSLYLFVSSACLPLHMCVCMCMSLLNLYNFLCHDLLNNVVY